MSADLKPWALAQGVVHLEPQVEQEVAEQVPQEELAVLLNFPPTEKAKADITR
ncbi:MAG: hypothetical protein ABSG44_08095 [Thermodesulfobacteriota bacterium]|jgi:hypothetical protein